MATKRKSESEPLLEKEVKQEDTGSADEEITDEASRRQFIRKLLQPFGKDQLIEFLKDAAEKNPSAIKKLLNAAEFDPIHRKIFVHGLSQETTTEILTDSFNPYGEIENCNIVIDKITGKSKGFGFVLFKSRSGAQNALKQPQKKIGGRTSFCQLAFLGSVHEPSRKIYVVNLRADCNIDRLRSYFEKFGGIEDMQVERDQGSGKLKGYAFFTYRTAEGFRRALEEPKKIFEGGELHCKKAHENLKAKVPAAPVGSVLQPNDLALLYAPSSVMGLMGSNINQGLGVLQTSTLGAINGLNSGLIGGFSPAALQALGISQNSNLGVLQPVGKAGLSESTIAGITGVSSSLIGGYSPAALQALGSSQNPNLGVLQPLGTAGVSASTLGVSLGANSGLFGGYSPAALQALGSSQNPNLGVLHSAGTAGLSASRSGEINGASSSFIRGYPSAAQQAIGSAQSPNLGVLQPVGTAGLSASRSSGINGVSSSLIGGHSPAALQALVSSQNRNLGLLQPVGTAGLSTSALGAMNGVSSSLVGGYSTLALGSSQNPNAILGGDLRYAGSKLAPYLGR